ncbi:MAG TPA: YCF48-related protein [Saprospiraceae bacterium]|nr:YCF48-related protein [Saprospiraceae bacterium]
MHFTLPRHLVMGLWIILIILALPLASIAQWTLLNSGTSESLNEIVFPVPDTGYVVGENGTVIRTVNGGEEWTALNPGTTKHVNDLFFFDAGTGVIVGDSGLYSITYDAGVHWSTTYLMPEQAVDLSSVFFTSSLIGYVGGRSNVSSGIILKTTDGGITWEETVTPSSLLDVQYKRIVFPTPDIGYALTRGMCMKTTDGGDHWHLTDSALVSSGGMFSILEDAFFFSADTGLIVGWYNGFSGYTTNGGQSWTDQMLSNNQWYSLDFPSRDIGYLIGWSQLMKTSDGGQTWRDETSSLISASIIYSMDFTNDHTGYACGANGVIIKTTSGGITNTEEISVADDLTIYPNPSDGRFHIELNKVFDQISTSSSILVYSSQGEKVAEAHGLQVPAQLNLEEQPAGLYLLVLVAADKQYTTKVLIQ